MKRIVLSTSFLLFGCMGPAAVPAEKAAEAAPLAEAAPGSEAPAAQAAVKTAPGDHTDHAACPHGIHEGGAGCDQEPDAPKESTGHFGAPFSLESAVALGKAIGGDDGEKTVRVTGTVDAVCQKKGCWMVLADGETKARILMKDHAFAVPMDCKGKSAEVEGTLKARTFTEDQVKHLEEDRGGDPKAVSGESKEYVLTATTVRVAES